MIILKGETTDSFIIHISFHSCALFGDVKTLNVWFFSLFVWQAGVYPKTKFPSSIVLLQFTRLVLPVARVQRTRVSPIQRNRQERKI
jgi:hypothetical protein